MYRCPSCHERGISFWSKQLYTMWTLPTCALCGQRARLSLPWVFLYSLLLILIVIPVFVLVLGYVASEGNALGGLFAAFATALLLANAGFHLLPLVPQR